MKFRNTVLFILLICSATIIAQSRIGVIQNDTGEKYNFSTIPFTELKVGAVNLEDVEAGTFIGGISTGRNIDDSFFWGVEMNFMRSVYSKETTIAEFDGTLGGFTDKQVELDFSTNVMSTTIQLYYERSISNRVIFARGMSGVGWSFIWNKENNFVDNVQRTRFFNGFTWQGSVGLGFRASQLGLVFTDLYYQNMRARKSEDQLVNGLPVFKEIDLSGFGVRVGVNFILLKTSIF